MTTKISTDNIQSATLATIGSGPKVTQILVCDSTYTALDDTAVSLTGGYIKIVGTGFKSGATVTVNRQQATSVTFVDSTELRAQLPAEAAGTYIIYVVNTDGSVALRVNGVTFSSLPTWTTASNLAAGDSGSLISLQLLAADAATYVLATGSTLPPGLILSSSGLLSGTVEIADETLYNFTVVATDAELQDSPRSFSINISVGDPYFNSTTLLLSGSANTFVKDASANNFPVVVVGDTKPNKFNPYLNGWSTQFTTKTNYVSVPATTNLKTFTGDFTFEAWICPADTTVTYWGIWDSRESGASANGMIFMLEPRSPAVAGQGRLKYYNGTSYYGTGIVYYNCWSHVAFVRSGTTMTFYVNGVAGGTATVSGTQSGSATANPIWVGSKDTASTYGTLGYISNLRVVNGSAVYTSNFTPSTAPLTAVANTVLLTFQNNRYRDAGANAYTLTPSGANISGFSPFLESVSTNGSGYFDGTGDYLTVPSNSAFQFGSGDFTVECWVYINALGVSGTWFAGPWGVSGGTNRSWDFAYYPAGGGIVFGYSTNGTNGTTITGSTTLSLNTWYHVAAVRSGNTCTIYQNGISIGSASMVGTTINPGTNSLWIGANPEDNGGSNFMLNGYISNLRVVKGIAAYTSNFTPPTQPLTAVSGTSLLALQSNLPVNNSTFLDSSSVNSLITRTGNTTQGSFSPYSPSGWSNYFDGTGDYLTVTAATTLGTDSFTIEAWVYRTSASADENIFVQGVSGTDGFGIAITANAVRVRFGGTNLFTSTATLAQNTWYHVALVRNGTTLTGYLNGASFGTSTNSSNQTATQWNIGHYGAGTYVFTGYISNLRVLKGTATYTANFTPPTQPLTTIAGTSLLTCADNRFVDESPNNFAITKSGDTRVANWSPFIKRSEYSATFHSGSMYFDGTGDSVQIATATSGFATSNFTIELWFNTSVKLNSTPVVLSNGNFAAGKWQLNDRHSGTPTKITFNVYNASTANGWLTSSSVIANNCWYHVAIVRNGSTFRMYLNGILEATATSTASVDTGAQTIYVGQDAGQAGTNYNGYISDLRITKGQALYTSNFVPPETPVLPVADTTLLLNGTGSAIADASTKNDVETAGDAKISTAVSKFGGSSMYFDGTSDYLMAPTNPSYAFGTGDFTIEAWIYRTDAGVQRAIIDTRGGSNVGALFYITTNNKLNIFDSTSMWISSTSTIPINQWVHVAAARSNAVTKLFINGNQESSAADSRVYVNGAGGLLIGRHFGSTTNDFIGYMQDVRITKGVARYTTSFTPPTNALRLK